LGAQTLAQSAVLPGPLGCLVVGLCLLPAVLSAALPVGFLVGALGAGRRWTETGQMGALYAAGLGARRLVGALLGLGARGGALEALSTRLLEPLGRGGARRELASAESRFSAQAGQPAQLGDLLLRAGAVEDGVLRDLFVARGDVVVSAAQGTIAAGP